MNTIRAQTYFLRRSCAHLSVLKLLCVLAAGTISPALHAAPVENSSGSDQDHRPARRDNLKPAQRRPQSPLALFDADHDGRLSSAEIAASSAVLRKLDANADGQLSGREMLPPRPPGATNHSPGEMAPPDSPPDAPPDSATDDRAPPPPHPRLN